MIRLRCAGGCWTTPAGRGPVAPRSRSATMRCPAIRCSWSTSPGSGGRAATGFGSVTRRVCRSGSTPTSTPTCAATRWRNFYHNRSGVPIEAEYVGAEYARAAGHAGVAPNQGDLPVGCVPGACPEGERYDVRGGWYDAGDHGKYVVNG